MFWSGACWRNWERCVEDEVSSLKKYGGDLSTGNNWSGFLKIHLEIKAGRKKELKKRSKRINTRKKGREGKWRKKEKRQKERGREEIYGKNFRKERN